MTPTALSRVATALVALAACGAPATDTREATPLAASPSVVACAAGERVRLAVSGGSGRALYDFALSNDHVALADVDRTRGTATVVCSVAGSSEVVVSAPNATVAVPVVVRDAPAGAIRLSLAPTVVAMTNGTTAWLTASVASSLPDASTGARYASSDTSIVGVDSATGQLRAVGRGQTTVAAWARADPSVRQVATVTVVPGGVLVANLAISTPPLTMLVGDSATIVAAVTLNGTAPATTARGVAFAPIDSQIVRVSATGGVRALRAGITGVVVSAVAAPLIRSVVPVQVRQPAP